MTGITNKQDFIKVKNKKLKDTFCHEWEDKPQIERKILAEGIFDKILFAKMYKEVLNSAIRKQTTQ